MMLRRSVTLRREAVDEFISPVTTLRAVEALTVGEPVAAPPLPEFASGRREFRLRRLLLVADLMALALAMCTWTVLPVRHLDQHLLWAAVSLPFWIVLFNAYGLYGTGLHRVGHATIDDISALCHALLVGSVGLWLFFQVAPGGKLAFSELLVFTGSAFLLSTALRSLARALAVRAMGPERVLFVGSGPMTPILVRQILAQPRHGMEPVYALTREENGVWPLPLEPSEPLVDADPVAVIHEYQIERVIVSAEGIEDEALLELVNACRLEGVKINALPSLAAMMGSRATLDDLEGITLIGINAPALPRSSRYFKRAMDIVGAAVLLALTSPVWIVAAIAVKLDSPGPILFRQSRIGRQGKPFRLTKFRSMIADAEARREALLAMSRQDKWLDLENDPRITRVGRILRHTSIDELPQLWNVLKGDMSLVGPRPLIAEEDQNVSGWARRRLDLTPGITGPWQVMGRARIPFEQMIMLDYLYVANWSLWADVRLLIETVPVVITRRGAN
jgi:exopolysaccharide biosynthesis polyprenyl glycosylphosphotransferase